MAHHAYFFAGEREAGLTAARAFARASLALEPEANPDVVTFTHGLFSVADARRVGALAQQQPIGGDDKLLIIAAERIFHEAQNALLKLFEEPPAGTTLILIVPSEGIVLATLRSRLLPLPGVSANAETDETVDFIAASSGEREKVIEKILTRAKSDKDDEKQAARGEALRLAEGLARAAHHAWKKESRKELELLLADLNRFIPILHERSAPLKQIFEHLLLVLPKKL